MSSILIILLSLAGICLAEPTWTTLRVTWGVNVFSSNVFAKVPLTTSDVKEYGFKELEGACTSGNFIGYRYIKNNDPAIVLIYDSKGFIAGMQSGIPKYNADRVDTTYPFSSTPAFQLYDDTFFRTVYFVNPSTICESDRTKEQVEENIGTGLWIQNGSDPIGNSLEIKTNETDLKDSKWTKGKCFYSMGQHYWYDISKDMNCDKLFPYFLLYNRGKLTGFGFASVGNFVFSPRFEHPSKSSFNKFIDPVPRCLEKEFDKAGGFTTMHVFFTVRPWNLYC